MMGLQVCHLLEGMILPEKDDVIFLAEGKIIMSDYDEEQILINGEYLADFLKEKKLDRKYVKLYYSVVDKEENNGN